MNISECKQLIASADVCGHVPLITGPHGIGKSEINAQYAKEQDLHFECLILSLMDTADLMGMPITTTVGGLQTTQWASPDWYSRIVDNAWPQTMQIEDLDFKDTDFKAYVESRLNCK